MGMADREQRSRHDYVRDLEVERKKIEVFQRELPLSLQLITQAIESVEGQMCEEERSVSGNEPVLAEFIPLKPSLASTVEEDVEISEPAAIGFDAKPDWLRSAQLWNQCADTGTKVEPPKRPIAVSVKRMGGAFQPFEREKHAAPPPLVSASAAACSNTSGSGSGGGGDGNGRCGGAKEKEGQSQTNRKVRRCWSPELHRCFLDALQLLGGIHVATPKQIRELMNVDGLTNDEVKSHLQKYRLHNRRPGTAAQSTSSALAPQIVLVGGIFVPPRPELAAARFSSDLISPKQRQQQAEQLLPGSCSRDGESGDDDEVTYSESLTASTTSQTRIASPSF
ncbi:transcription factor NIGT1-like [Zingiber officinale]|uniref:transcription factor NIGT1-like n=1 Tax=Zingiber officinale TaxID=94328 RepID=UPI001C4BE9C2|nr:transcription factor NIGT1-like [Zingiber officinale]